MPTPLKILIVEDSPDDCELMLDELRSWGFDPQWTRIDTHAGYLAALEETWDIILSDAQLPQFTAADALLAMKERRPHTPFIVVTGALTGRISVGLIRQGADNFILKTNLEGLGPSIQNVIESHTHERARKKAEAALQISEARYRLIFDIMKETVLMVDTHGTIKFTNAAAETTFGWPPAELIGRPLITIIPERLRETHLTGFHQYIQTRTPHLPTWSRILGLTGLHRDGREVPVEVSFSETEMDGELVFVGVLWDMTVLRQSESTIATLHATLDEVHAQIASLRGGEHA